MSSCVTAFPVVSTTVLTISSCILENKIRQDLINEIIQQQKDLHQSDVIIHLILQFAAEKRCANPQKLIQSYQKMLSHTYRDDDWPKQEQLDKIFPYSKNPIVVLIQFLV